MQLDASLGYWRDTALREITLREMQATELRILETVVAICRENGLRCYPVGGTLLGAVRHQGFIPWDDDVDVALPRGDFDRLETICRQQLPKHYKWIDYKDDFRLPGNLAKVCDTRTVLIQRRRADYEVPLGVYIDIFPLDGMPKTHVLQELHHARAQSLRMLICINSLDASRPRPLVKRLIVGLVQGLMGESSVRSMQESLERTIRRYGYDSAQEICNYLGRYGRRERVPKAWIGEGTAVTFEGLEMTAFSEYHKYLSRIYGDYLALPPLEHQKPHDEYRVSRAD